MCAKPARPLDVALCGRHFVEEPNEPARVVAAVPGVLGAQLVGFQFKLTAHSQKIEAEDEAEPLEAVLQRIVGSNAERATRPRSARDPCETSEYSGDGEGIRDG